MLPVIISLRPWLHRTEPASASTVHGLEQLRDFDFAPDLIALVPKQLLQSALCLLLTVICV